MLLTGLLDDPDNNNNKLLFLRFRSRYLFNFIRYTYATQNKKNLRCWYSECYSECFGFRFLLENNRNGISRALTINNNS